MRKLTALNAAPSLNALRVPPANHLEAFGGEREGQRSIRINGQWRICPMGISQYRLARDIGVDPRRINAIIHGRRAITADTELRLDRYFGIEPEFWMNLQTHYDLEIKSDRLAGKLEQEVKIRSAA